MRLPWRRPSSHAETSDDDDEGLREARAAAEDAAMKLRATHRRGPVIDRLVARVAELQEDNHFSERVEAALRRGYGENGGH